MTPVGVAGAAHEGLLVSWSRVGRREYSRGPDAFKACGSGPRGPAARKSDGSAMPATGRLSGSPGEDRVPVPASPYRGGGARHPLSRRPTRRPGTRCPSDRARRVGAGGGGDGVVRVTSRLDAGAPGRRGVGPTVGAGSTARCRCLDRHGLAVRSSRGRRSGSLRPRVLPDPALREPVSRRARARGRHLWPAAREDRRSRAGSRGSCASASGRRPR